MLQFFYLGSYPTPNMSTARDWDKFQAWAPQLLGPIKAMGSSDVWPVLSGNAAFNLGVCPRTAPVPKMQDPAWNLDFFARTWTLLPAPLPLTNEKKQDSMGRSMPGRGSRGRCAMELGTEFGATRIWWAKLALFLFNYFAVVEIVTYPRMWLPKCRANHMNCGAWFRNVEFR